MYQLNCGKRTASTLEIPKWRFPDILLIQEPNWNLLKQISKFGNVYSFDNHSRAIIYTKSNIDATQIPSFTNKDVIAIQLEKQNTILCSAYFDINLPVWPKELNDLVIHCQSTGTRLIIGCDSNAHSTMWGCSANNARGDALERAIIQHHLFVHNTGHDYTFDGGVGQSKIDITLSNRPNEVVQWEVSREISYSDHKIISFRLQNTSPTFDEVVRNVKKVQWRKIAIHIENNLPPIPTMWNRKVLDQANNELTRIMREALDKEAPEKPPAKRASYWWNDTCSQAKAELKRAETTARTNKSATFKIRLKDKRNKYNSCIRKARRQAWRTYVREINSTQESSRVGKIMRSSNGPTPKLGLVHHQGNLTSSKQGTLEAMLEEHFPGSSPWQPETPPSKLPLVELDELDWLSSNTFRAATKIFKHGKSPGPDEFRAECLNVLLDETVNYIVAMFKASITLGYVPEQWRHVKCIFIPKPGKPDYSHKRAFRPISLMSVLFKTLERMVLWHIEEENLKHDPIHRLQFGFRKGRSTEMALSRIVNQIEKGNAQKQFVLGLFCDIAGAFDNVAPESITRMMQDRGVDDRVIQWYSHFLYHRKVESSLGTATAAISPGKGTPQGGVLSAIISWNLVFDDLLRRFDNLPTRPTAFADDNTLMATGKFIPDVYQRMQEAINIAVEWATEHGLSFCPNKTYAVLFTKQTVKNLPKLYMNGQVVPQVKEAKVLGVTLDHKLAWTPHITQKVTKCKKALMQLLPIMRKTWSPQPRYNRWLYKDVILPMLLYGSHLWSHKLENKAITDKLRQIQRLGLLSVAAVRRSTPTAGLELIYNIPPLHLMMKERVAQTALRLKPILQDGDWVGDRLNSHSHLRLLQAQLPEDHEVADLQTPMSNVRPPYTVYIRDEPTPEEGIRVFTDGSLIQGQSGAGVVVYKDLQKHKTISEKLPTCTVFQAELRAIRAACMYLTYETGTIDRQTPVHFYVDSQAALKALVAPAIKSIDVLNTMQLLKQMSFSRTVTLQWIKAHIGWEGNEAADAAAKKGALSPGETVVRDIPKSSADVKQQLKQELHKAWTKVWQARKDCRQTRAFVPAPNPKIWKDIRKYPLDKTRRTVRFLTGHTFMQRHNALIELGSYAVDDDIAACRLCCEEEETPIHLTTECPCLNRQRLTLLNAWQLDRPPPWSKGLADFILLPIITDLESDESGAAID